MVELTSGRFTGLIIFSGDPSRTGAPTDEQPGETKRISPSVFRQSRLECVCVFRYFRGVSFLLFPPSLYPFFVVFPLTCPLYIYAALRRLRCYLLPGSSSDFPFFCAAPPAKFLLYPFGSSLRLLPTALFIAGTPTSTAFFNVRHTRLGNGTAVRQQEQCVCLSFSAALPGCNNRPLSGGSFSSLRNRSNACAAASSRGICSAKPCTDAK